MQTKRLLKIVILAVFLLLGAISFAVYGSLARYRAAEQKQSIVATIAQSVFERRLFADDYLIDPTERAKAQWYAEQRALEQLIIQENGNFQTASEKPYFDSLKASLQESRSTFNQVVDTFSQAKPSDTQLLQSKKARFTSQLTLKAQEAIVATNNLLSINVAHAQRELNQAVVLFLMAVSVLAIVLSVCFRLVWRSAGELERRQAQEEAMLGSIGDGVFAVDITGKIILFNKSAEAMTGLPAESVIGKPYQEILTFQNETNGTTATQFVATALSGKRAEMPAHTILRRRDGQFIPVADSAAPIVDPHGRREGAVVVFRDTTQERQVEQMKDEFLSIASHELRTPMGAIRASLSMVLAGDYGPINKDLVEPLNDMKTSTIRLVDLVTDLLDVARIEAGRTKFSLSNFDLREVARATVASLAPLGKEKGIAITLAPGKEVHVQADADKIKQALTNLMGNSLKFTDHGSIKVTVTKQDDMAEVAVADTGIGIATEDQKKLFGKFEQISSAQAGKPAGTGLGLYISREIIRKLGGELWIKHSVVGKGSIFALTLPCADTAGAQKVKQLIEHEAALHPDQK